MLACYLTVVLPVSVRLPKARHLYRRRVTGTSACRDLATSDRAHHAQSTKPREKRGTWRKRNHPTDEKHYKQKSDFAVHWSIIVFKHAHRWVSKIPNDTRYDLFNPALRVCREEHFSSFSITNLDIFLMTLSRRRGKKWNLLFSNVTFWFSQLKFGRVWKTIFKAKVSRIGVI